MSNLDINYQEMWGEQECDIQAEHTGIGSKPYRITSKFPLPASQGVESAGQVGEYGANMTKNKRVGWYKYYMTRKAFEKLHKTNKVVLNCLLD
jgi:adenylosuccinate synthase